MLMSMFNVHPIKKIDDVLEVKSRTTNFVKVLATFRPEHPLIVIADNIGQLFAWARSKAPQSFKNILVAFNNALKFIKVDGLGNNGCEMPLIICLKHIQKVAIDDDLNIGFGEVTGGIVI